MGWFTGLLKVCLAVLIIYFTALVIDTRFGFLHTIGLEALSLASGNSIAWQKVATYLFVFGFLGWMLYKD